MKKINVLLIIVFSAIFLSCGKKEGNNDVTETEAAKEVVKDCGCNELELTETDEDGNVSDKFKSITKKGSKELFTGSCVEKDQNDSIIRKVDVKNGWLTQRVIKDKFKNKYMTTEDMKYDQGSSSEGYYRLFAQDENKDYYVTNIKSYKNSEIYDEFSIFLNGNKEGNPYKISLSFEYNKGEYATTEVKTKCMPESEFSNFSGFRQSEVSDISPERYYEILDCLKKEYPQFDYWRSK